MNATTLKIVGGLAALAAAVSLFFWIKSLRADLALAESNLATETEARKATELQLDLVRRQIVINRQAEAEREEGQARDRGVALDIKGVTSRADPKSNRPAAVVLDVFDRLRSSAEGAGAGADPAGGPAGQRAPVPGRAANSPARHPRAGRRAGGTDHRRHHARRPRLPACRGHPRQMVGAREGALCAEAVRGVR